MGINRNIHRPIKEDYICSDKQAAVIRLNKYPVYSGRPVVVRYYSNPEKTRVDVIFAIGIKNDESGPDSYRLVCSEGILLTTDIVYEYPDVTQLVQGQLYLYRSLEEKQNYWVYLKGNDRIFTKVNEESFLTNSNDNKKYYVTPTELYDLTKFYERETLWLEGNLGELEVTDNIKKIESVMGSCSIFEDIFSKMDNKPVFMKVFDYVSALGITKKKGEQDGHNIYTISAMSIQESNYVGYQVEIEIADSQWIKVINITLNKFSFASDLDWYEG